MSETKTGVSNVYWFNATCEMAVGNATNSYMPPKHLRIFDADLSFLPYFFAEDGDVVLCENKPSDDFLARISKLRNYDVKFLSLQEVEKKAQSGDLKFDRIKPWGWSPVAHKRFQQIKSACSQAFQSSVHSSWNPEHRELYSRKTALGVLESFLNWTDRSDLFLPKEWMPRIGHSLDEVKSFLSPEYKSYVKAPWSSSGRGLIILHEGAFHDTYTNWINGFVKSQGYVMVERALPRLYDLSFHFEVTSDKVHYLGNASFQTEENGQYIGNNLRALPSELTKEESDFLSDDLINHVAEGLKAALEKCPIFGNYEGVLGIDAILFRDIDGALRIQPCLEINLRYNMGTLALKIRESVHSNAQGYWKVQYLGKEDAVEFDTTMQSKHPLCFKNDKIISGYMPLIEPTSEKQFAVYLWADPTVLI